jgi:predicted DNA-binding transcriptional regulator YafY
MNITQNEIPSGEKPETTAIHQSAGATARVRTGQTRPPLARMLKIYQWLLRRKYPNCTNIMMELSVSLKTAMRDLEFMRKKWDLPIAFDCRRNGYYFSSPPGQIPCASATKKKTFALFVAQKAIEKHAGTPPKKNPKVACKDLTSLGAITEETFVRPENFTPKNHLGSSLGVMEGQGDYEVVIEMDAWLTDILRGRRWHPSQVWDEMPAGGSRLRLRLSCLEEIEQWILSWGTHALVLRPAVLVERLARTAQELVNRYPNPSQAAKSEAPICPVLTINH